MLKCEGYIMFKGVMKIITSNEQNKHIDGIWLYKPEYNCWYCNGSSYPATVCEILVDNTK